MSTIWKTGLMAVVLASAAAHAGRPVNVVFILADDLGWADVGADNPHTFYETPHIDRLAREGVRFSMAYAAAPVCSPTRAAILTGQYPARIPLTDYIPGARAEKLRPADYLHHLPQEQVTLAETFAQAGYATFFAGKWHLGGPGSYPEDHGFEINQGGWQAGGPFRGGQYFPPYANPRLTDGPLGEHLDERLAQETAKFIEANRDRPFLAYLSFYSVHTPLVARPELVSRYQAKRDARAEEGDMARWGTEGRRDVRLVQDLPVYAAMVHTMDRAVGIVLEKLQELGLAQNTVVIFTSDNGGLSTSEGFPTSNLPLRAGKGWLYEGGIRVPLIIRAPGHGQAGAVCNVPVTSPDFYPTLLELAGLRAAPQQHIDGVSLVPWLKDPAAAPPHRAIYWHYPHYGNQGSTPGGAMLAGKFKIIEFFEDQQVELYDLWADVSERRDLSHDMPREADEMRRALHDWRKRIGAKMPTSNPDYDPAAVAATHQQANQNKQR